MPATAPAKPGSLRAEQIILFRIGEQLFALSSSSVQEVRSADSLSGGAATISAPSVDKVTQFVRRGQNTLFLVSGAKHFGLPVPEGILAFVPCRKGPQTPPRHAPCQVAGTVKRRIHCPRTTRAAPSLRTG